MVSPEEPAIRNVSDTALWVAIYRAQESERADALFHDPFARLLGGERGARIAAAAPFMSRHSWSMVERTWLIDRMIAQELAAGTDTVINLAAGLDTRPYRLDLPPSLRWIEVDLPPLLEYKESILADATPRCRLQRERCDLSDPGARRALFARLGELSSRALVITEGLLIYLTSEDVATLARDLAAVPSLQHWVFDLCNPGVLRMMARQHGSMSADLARANSPFRFAPAEGPAFFRPMGWRPLQVEIPLRWARKHHRLPSLWMRLGALMPQSLPANGRRPWSGICYMERTVTTGP